MSYRKSAPLERWFGERRRTIAVLAQGHAAVGGLGRPGPPLAISRPLAHAYIIVMLREFQAFARDLHDISVECLVTASGAARFLHPMLTEGLIGGRALDRGNATQAAIKNDFKRIGLVPINIGVHNKRWSGPDGGDKAIFDVLVELRNALGHGNEVALDLLISTGRANDTLTWARDKRPVLNRYARALDRIVWDHLVKTIGSEPW